MDRVCSHCHAEVAHDSEADWCPACGGALLERAVVKQSSLEHANSLTSGANLPTSDRPANSPEVDHRGIVLPRRHALGGIITPQ